jgi:hypothetical protein
MAAYLRDQAAALAQQPAGQVVTGTLHFSPPPVLDSGFPNSEIQRS